MLTSTRKVKDDFIGGRDFSRVRRYDDEARKARIFASNAPIAIDVNKLDDQLKEKEEQRHQKELSLKEEESRKALEKQCWDKEDEELRKQRIQARSTLEQCWTKQHEEFTERWKHRPYELSEKVGLLPVQRYQFQDGEVVKEANVTRRICEAWNQQIEDHNARLRQEMEDRKQNDLQLDMERKNWEKTQKEIAKELFNSNVDMANEYLRQHQEKNARDKKTHDEEHFYEISKAFFEQFQTRSR
ncbi:hypothetical protein GOP47_0023753 [Adiantum capillus-veneris]|uniref:Uncharacterized protein n=1 Tax=Adiantum capillus-veneris TaxID=13818 RepID=A0A9D4U594_ADICA|nr:hypothetical protein GOP47_0023753 [Adiantum capillus-veneris]